MSLHASCESRLSEGNVNARPPQFRDCRFCPLSVESTEMQKFSKWCRLAVVVGVALAAAASGVHAWDELTPPNWRGGGTGTTTPVDIVEVGFVDADTFSGHSTLLGRFTGKGFHVLNLTTFEFEGQATWTAANGDTLEVTYAGQVFPSDDPDYPFGFVATLTAIGGTGRLAEARGNAAMTGGFTGVPGKFYFDVEGSLHPRGK
jgi:hypothetical protein